MQLPRVYCVGNFQIISNSGIHNAVERSLRRHKIVIYSVFLGFDLLGDDIRCKPNVSISEEFPSTFSSPANACSLASNMPISRKHSSTF